MSDPFLGEVQIFGFDFAPNDWAKCNGQIMPIVQNTALFALLGTNFGGDGKTTYALPNFQEKAACAVGQGPRVTERTLGEAFGSEAVSLLVSEMPSHNHTFDVFNQSDVTKRHDTPLPGDALLAPGAVRLFVPEGTVSGNFPVVMVAPAGSGEPHENRQPYMALNFCIALQGLFPPRP